MIDKYFITFDYNKKKFSYDDIALFEFKAKSLILLSLDNLTVTLKKHSWMFSKNYLTGIGNPVSKKYSSEYDIEICPTSYEDQVVWRDHFDDFLVNFTIWTPDGPFNDLETIFNETNEFVERCKIEIPSFKEAHL